MPVTIGIPFYNVERFIPDMLRSVFAQTYTDWELILVNDGSTDRSLEIIESVKDERIKVISDGKKGKLGDRRNKIIQAAKYEIIAVMDADDIMHPKRLGVS